MENTSRSGWLHVKRKISNGQWKTLDNELKKEPINGLDIITTIDSEIQDIVHDYLLEQTEKYDAHHSSAIVMEVQQILKQYQILD